MSGPSVILLGLRSSAHASRDGSLQPDWIGAWHRQLCQLPLNLPNLALHSAVSSRRGAVLHRSELLYPTRTHQAYVRSKASAHFLECHRAEPSLDLRNTSRFDALQSLVDEMTCSKIVHMSSTEMESCLLPFICPG